MRRSSVFESAKQKSKLMLLLFCIHSEGGKHLFLQSPLEDADGAATNFVSIQHHVIGICFNTCIWVFQVFTGIFNDRIVVDHDVYMVRLRRCKWVMPCNPAIIFLSIFEQWEI